MKLNKFYIFLIIVFSTSVCNAQSSGDLQKFFEDHVNFILKKAHSHSELLDSKVEVSEAVGEEYDFKVTIEVHYKGFFKKHSLKTYIYFLAQPLKFIWGEDSNFFKPKTNAEIVLESLKEKWSNWSRKE